MERYDVIIIGGGIAGTSAGFELSKKSSVIILEQEKHPGYHATIRRSAILIDGPDNRDPSDWAMVVEFNEEFYFKPEAGKLLASPANEDPSEPCDAQPEVPMRPITSSRR